MAKKFEFRLEALLKLREFKEKEIKVELGRILKEISNVEDEIVEINKSIDMTYESQESLSGKTVTGRFMSFYPTYVEGRKADIAAKENLIFALKRKYQEKLKEMYVARGETKVIDKLKEKEFIEFKKETNKKMEQNIEENIIITRSGSEDNEGEIA